MATAQPAPRLQHVPALDGLRGVAVAAVLMFHGGHLVGGFLGVDLFFALSGFLITSLLLAESSSSGTVNVGAFWARRARRLLPALTGLLVGVAVLCVVFARPSELHQMRGDLLATLFYVTNWRDAFANQEYWSLFTDPSPLQHTWSLAIEEQFYLVWPLIFVGLLAWRKRSAPKAVLSASLGLALASGALMVALYNPTESERVYYGTDTRAAAVLLGAALAASLAIWGPVRGRLARSVVELGGVLGLVLLACAWTQLDGQSTTLYRGGFFVCGLAAVAVLASATHPTVGPVGRVLQLRPLCALGLISYGLYLWHWPVYLVLDAERTGLDGWVLLAARVAMTLVIATASCFLLEQPIRRGALSARQTRVALPSVAFGLVVLIFVVTAQSSPPIAVASAGREWNRPADSPASRRTRVLVVGDSVSASLVPGLQNASQPSRLDVVLGAAVGCDAAGRRHGFDSTPPPTTPCPPAWSQLVEDMRPDVVLIVDSGLWTLRDTPVDGRLLRVGTPQFDAHRRARLQQNIATFTATGARVVITSIAYARAANAAALLSSSVANPALVDQANDQLADVAARNEDRVSLVDLKSYVCPNERYQEGLESVATVRPDGIHYGIEGSDLVGRWLAPQLAHAVENRRT